VDQVKLVLRKYDGRLHRWVGTRRLGEDEHGVWLGTPAGTTVHYNYGTRATRTTRLDAVRLIPRDQWWIAMFTAEPADREVYCDVCLPPVWTSPAEVTVVDMDLDLARFRTGDRVLVEDEDEFAANAATYGYSAEAVTEATATAAGLHAALTERAEPFAVASRPWLDQLAGRARSRRAGRPR
jgi:protein associated with RNAse G/E